MKHAFLIIFACTTVFGAEKEPASQLQKVESALQEQSQELERQRKLTGGALLGAGGALTLAALGGHYIGNDYANDISPSYYGGLAAASTLMGFYVFFSSTSVEKNVDEFNNMSPLSRVEELHSRVSRGESLLRTSSRELKFKRILGGSLLLLQGAGQFYMSRTDDTIQSRDNLQRSGFGWSSIGLIGYAVDPHVLGMGTTFGIGAANLISYSTDPNASSKDYFLASGFFSSVLGITRLVFQNESEKNWQKYEHLSFIPTHGGFLSNISFEWN